MELQAILTLFFSAMVAVATIVYAILTWKLVTETKGMRRVQTEPKVAVYVEFDEQIQNKVYFVIQNIGLGPAYDIQFEIDPDFVYFKNKGMTFSSLGIINDGLSFLPPNQKLSFYLLNMIGDYEGKLGGKPITVKTTYRNSFGQSSIDTYHIDLARYLDLSLPTTDTLGDVVRELKEIREEIHRLSR